jgi:hypothetical protein
MTTKSNFSGLLDPGERLVWSGTPDALRYAVRKSKVSFPFGIFFFGFSIFWVYGAMQQSGLPFALFGVPFVAIGLVLVVSPLWHFIRGLRATYLVTDQRAVIDISGFFPKRISVPTSQIRFVELKFSRSGFGDVLFREIVASGDNGNSVTRDGFIAVAEADRADFILRAAVDKSRRAGAAPA